MDDSRDMVEVLNNINDFFSGINGVLQGTTTDVNVDQSGIGRGLPAALAMVRAQNPPYLPARSAIAAYTPEGVELGSSSRSRMWASSRSVTRSRAPIRSEIPFTGTNGRRVYDYIFAPVFGSRSPGV